MGHPQDWNCHLTAGFLSAFIQQKLNALGSTDRGSSRGCSVLLVGNSFLKVCNQQTCNNINTSRCTSQIELQNTRASAKSTRVLSPKAAAPAAHNSNQPFLETGTKTEHYS